MNKMSLSKVADFFSLCSWEGEQNRSLKTYTYPSDWRCQTVKEFFSQNNWQGLSHRKPVTTTPENSLTLSVQDFFELVNWESDAIIAAVTELNSLPPKPSEDSLTLKDLFDLF